MNISGVNANIAARFQPSSKVQAQQVSIEQQPDTVEFKGNNCSENMSIKKTNISITEPQYSYTGTINGKESYIETKQSGVLNPIKTVNGKIGDSIITYTQEYTKKIPAVKKMTGEYNGKTFELSFNPALLLGIGTSTLVGKIDGEDVEFQFPGSKIPEDSEIKDIISSILTVDGYKPVCSGNEFNKLSFSDWKQKQNDEAAMAIAMSQPAYTPTWHYDTMGMPGGMPMYY